MNEDELTEAIGDFVDANDGESWRERAQRVLAAAEFNGVIGQLKELVSWFKVNDDDELEVT